MVKTTTSISAINIIYFEPQIQIEHLRSILPSVSLDRSNKTYLQQMSRESALNLMD
jgi:hypothetical protein